MFDKILIANRGEIAVRIIRACREMGIKTVAVYSDADRDSLHTMLADEAICIGPSAASQSYLNMERILSATVSIKAQAIHPGFGFLSENARFAELCKKCNITFIGPSAEIINKMGNKSEARKTMMDAGVPVVPGGREPVRTVEEGLALAKDIGFPVMIKASSGGGGKGMRVSYGQEDFEANFQNAQMESMKGFSDDTMYLERFVEKPRHIEFQIMADKFGNVVHLGERDCSIQRRHQKVLEESPSVAISQELRKKMGETAVRAAKAVGYENAGTIEFLLDKNKNFYFMEMNTRIQVEHPVTEMVSGLDLIKEQMEKGLVDIGILLEPVDMEKFEFIRLAGMERWVVLMRPDDFLAGKAAISAKDLENKPLILPRRLNVQSELLHWFGDSFQSGQVLLTSNLSANGALMVQKGLAYSIVIEGAVRFWDKEKIICRPLSPEWKADSAVAWKRNQLFSLAAEKFIEHIKCFLSISDI